MLVTLTFLHSVFRWLVLISLMYAIYRAFNGYIFRREFSKHDDAVRHWTATIAHIQLMLGILIYTQSPLISYFWKNKNETSASPDFLFFSVLHPVLMFITITVLTVGSAKAKRVTVARQKFSIMIYWFIIALVLIFIAIPWPFSPLSNRPYFR